MFSHLKVSSLARKTENGTTSWTLGIFILSYKLLEVILVLKIHKHFVLRAWIYLIICMNFFYRLLHLFSVAPSSSPPQPLWIVSWFASDQVGYLVLLRWNWISCFKHFQLGRINLKYSAINTAEGKYWIWYIFSGTINSKL